MTSPSHLRSAPVFFGLALAVTAPKALAGAEAPDGSGGIVTQVENSDALKGGIDLSGSVTLDADVRTVWDVLTRCDLQLRYVPGLERCEVVASGQETVLDKEGRPLTRAWDARRQTLDYAFPFPTIRTELRAVYTPGERIDFTAQGGDVKDLYGHWTLEPHAEGGTRVRYSATFKSGLPVPRSLVRKSSRKDLPLLFERLRAVTRDIARER
ncbi:MAG: SRPBCC family protein [Litorimonas sp.]